MLVSEDDTDAVPGGVDRSVIRCMVDALKLTAGASQDTLDTVLSLDPVPVS